MSTRFILAAWGCVEPEILGPFTTEAERVATAKSYMKEHGDESSVFRLDINASQPSTSSFINAEMEEPNGDA